MTLKAPYFRTWFRAEPAGRLPRRFAVVTAHDPRGRKTPATQNRAADRRLAAELDARGLRRFRVTGGSEDGSHREPGWGFASTARLARDLAARFDQNAYFWISGGRVYVGSASGGSLKRAGTWSKRRALWR